jgi:hypothetical protein
MSFKINWDALGISATLACAIHCALLPLLMTSLPVFGSNIIHNNVFEVGMILVSAAIGSYALWHGRKKHHHQNLPLYLFGLGMAFLLLKQVFEGYFLWFLLPAVVFIVWGHYLNYRLCRKANHCHTADCDH